MVPIIRSDDLILILQKFTIISQFNNSLKNRTEKKNRPPLLPEKKVRLKLAWKMNFQIERWNFVLPFVTFEAVSSLLPLTNKNLECKR